MGDSLAKIRRVIHINENQPKLPRGCIASQGKPFNIGFNYLFLNSLILCYVYVIANQCYL